LQWSRTASEPFASLGLVSGATFADLDGDGWPDLALALEWGAVRVFRNNHGKFEDVTAQWGLADRTGWWTSVSAGDFDGDGRLDLAVGNWGRNTQYELCRNLTSAPALGPRPSTFGPLLRVFYGDWDSGGLGLIEAWADGTNWFPVHNRLWLTRALPELVHQFPTHQVFAQATLREILGARYGNTQSVEATELQSGVFLNREGPKIRFDWVPLPRAAQLSPVFSVNVGDFDGDGREDLFISQNCFSAVPENASAEALSRNDGGRGLWLRGDGRGTFTAVDGSTTGIKIYGEQRGAALADFNHDGRVDLCVSQNSGTTKLYVNAGAKPGLRVTLRGAPGNPDAVGAQMRVVYANHRSGPCRSVTAGSGYWSQDAAAQVLGCAEEPVALWIRWPGGKEQTVPLEKGVWDVRVVFTDEKK
jgi:hypothetical protein